jgi:uncharacterized CHY-type Zn-finger protein
MFLIAGVQPKTKRISENPQPCPACGLTRAYMTRIDHYISLFFIPLIRVKQGEEFLLCDSCRQQEGHFTSDRPTEDEASATAVCVACKRSFNGSYRYCPFCGQRYK